MNQDGTLARIANWSEMTEIERERTLRILCKRNAQRIERLKEESQRAVAHPALPVAWFSLALASWSSPRCRFTGQPHAANPDGAADGRADCYAIRRMRWPSLSRALLAAVLQLPHEARGGVKRGPLFLWRRLTRASQLQRRAGLVHGQSRRYTGSVMLPRVEHASWVRRVMASAVAARRVLLSGHVRHCGERKFAARRRFRVSGGPSGARRAGG